MVGVFIKLEDEIGFVVGYMGRYPCWQHVRVGKKVWLVGRGCNSGDGQWASERGHRKK